MTGAETCNQHVPVPHHTHTTGGRDRMAIDESTLRRRITDGIRITDEGCWEWRGPFTHGYARVCVDRKRYRGHRLAYRLWRGEIPDGLVLDHLCRNKPCVNPFHLEAVTNRENLLRGDTLPARCVAATHCRHGHEFSPPNIRWKRDGSNVYRSCWECHKQDRARRDRKEAV